MWRNIMSLALMASSLATLAEATSSAQRFSEIIRSRQQKREGLMQEQLDAQAQQASNSSSSFRFLNSQTQKYQVKSLPDVHYNIGEMYAGNIPINKNDSSRSLYFIFQPTIGAPVDEITIWLNGGPGCSSLDGFLQENGRFLWQPGVFLPQENPYTWVNLTNMMWVDQPVGTGFTTGKPTAMNEMQIANDFADFFKNFQQTFGIKKFKIYVTGESYAGRYVPYISSAMLDRNDTNYYDLRGALVYDGVIGSFEYTQMEATMVPLIRKFPGLFNLNDTYSKQLDTLHKTCGYEALINKYLTYPPPGNQPQSPPITDACDLFDSVLVAASTINPCFDIYQINQQCPLLWDVKEFQGVVNHVYPGQTNYFDRDDVRQAVHAPANVTWSECKPGVFVGNGGPEGEGDQSPDPIQGVLPHVIERTNRVLVSTGDWDMIIQMNGTLLAIQNMTWAGKLGFQQKPSTPINIRIPDLVYQQDYADAGLAGVDGPQGIMGIQHYERGLMWAETYQCGHMQPQAQPRVSYRHIQWVLGRTETI